MNASARDEYLTHQVMTASPQRLQLMLIEAAVGAALRAQSQWEGGWDESVSSAILRCQRIVAQILSRLAVNGETPLVGQVASVYGFVYRALIAAHTERSVAKLADALRVLELERETWREVCIQVSTIPPVHFDTSAMAASDGTESGMSFEA